PVRLAAMRAAASRQASGGRLRVMPRIGMLLSPPRLASLSVAFAWLTHRQIERQGQRARWTGRSRDRLPGALERWSAKQVRTVHDAGGGPRKKQVGGTPRHVEFRLSSVKGLYALPTGSSC